MKSINSLNNNSFIPENYIKIAEYAKLNNKNVRTVRKKAENNGFKTVRKIDNTWYIDKNEPYIDSRYNYDIPDNYITLNKYAKIHNKDVSTIRLKLKHNSLKTVCKYGDIWYIDKNEPYIDNRYKSDDSIKNLYKNKFIAQIGYKNNVYYLGTYKNKDDAQNAYKRAKLLLSDINLNSHLKKYNSSDGYGEKIAIRKYLSAIFNTKIY